MTKPMKAVTLTAAMLAACLAGGVAHAHGGHVHYSVVVGAPGFWPYPYYAPYYPPYYAYPAPVVVPQSPPVYVERGDEHAAAEDPAQGQGYWYYCADAKAYYPYVKQCAGGWQRVVPQPPNS